MGGAGEQGGSLRPEGGAQAGLRYPWAGRSTDGWESSAEGRALRSRAEPSPRGSGAGRGRRSVSRAARSGAAAAPRSQAADRLGRTDLGP